VWWSRTAMGIDTGRPVHVGFVAIGVVVAAAAVVVAVVGVKGFLAMASLRNGGDERDGRVIARGRGQTDGLFDLFVRGAVAGTAQRRVYGERSLDLSGGSVIVSWVEVVGRSVEVVGRSVEIFRRSVEIFRRSVEVVRRSVEVVGRSMEVVGRSIVAFVNVSVIVGPWIFRTLIGILSSLTSHLGLCHGFLQGHLGHVHLWLRTPVSDGRDLPRLRLQGNVPVHIVPRQNMFLEPVVETVETVFARVAKVFDELVVERGGRPVRPTVRRTTFQTFDLRHFDVVENGVEFRAPVRHDIVQVHGSVLEAGGDGTGLLNGERTAASIPLLSLAVLQVRDVLRSQRADAVVILAGETDPARRFLCDPRHLSLRMARLARPSPFVAAVVVFVVLTLSLSHAFVAPADVDEHHDHNQEDDGGSAEHHLISAIVKKRF